MIKTLLVAADRAHDETKTVLPAEVARGVYIENPPSAETLKLMHLLIGTAGGRMTLTALYNVLEKLRAGERIEGRDKENCTASPVPRVIPCMVPEQAERARIRASGPALERVFNGYLLRSKTCLRRYQTGLSESLTAQPPAALPPSRIRCHKTNYGQGIALRLSQRRSKSAAACFFAAAKVRLISASVPRTRA